MTAPRTKLKGVPAILLAPGDTVATVLEAVAVGEGVRLSDGTILSATGEIPQFHKIAVNAVPQSGDIRKYGEVIGQATAEIALGELVHTHNLVSRRARY